MLKIIGLKVEKYIGEKVTGHNTRFKREPKEFERYILYCIQDNEFFSIMLDNEESICPSGWTNASYGIITIEKIEKIGSFNYIPKIKLEIEQKIIYKNGSYILGENEQKIQNDVFWYSHYGDDHWYPDGSAGVYMDNFIEATRNLGKRPVWIFLGESGTGKSSICESIYDLNIYETDSSSELPDVIISDIIVIGNKYKFNLDDIIKRIYGEVEIIKVDFSFYNKGESS